MLAAGVTGPEGHAQAHTEEAETEAVMRAAVIANQVGIKRRISELLNYRYISRDNLYLFTNGACIDKIF